MTSECERFIPPRYYTYVVNVDGMNVCYLQTREIANGLTCCK